MKKVKYNETDLQALINEVEAKFSTLVEKKEEKVVEETLVKSEADTVVVSAPVSETETLVKAEPEAKEKEAEEKEDKAIEMLEQAQEMEKEEGCRDDDEDYDYDDEDKEELEKTYKSLSKKQAKIHHEVLGKLMGVDVEKSESLAKSELAAETDLLKTELTTIKKENEDLKKSLQDLVTALSATVKAPARKAIVDVNYIPKTEIEENKEDVAKLTKSEIDTRLSAKIREGKLTKSDQESIKKFYLEKTSIDLIKHLL